MVEFINRIGAPVDMDGWQTAVTEAITVAGTTNPYIPSVAAGSTVLSMNNFTGVLVRAKYVSGETLTTDPIVAVWGKRGTSWQVLVDSNGARTTTLSDTAATDISNGVNKWTDSSAKIDALGCSHVVVTVITPAVPSSTVASIEFTRY